MTLSSFVPPQRDFASDNRSPIAPIALKGLLATNEGRAPSYGADQATSDADYAVSRLLGEDVEVIWVPTGTAANIVGVGALLPGPGSAVLCAEDAHVRLDEGGAIERVWGVPLIPAPIRSGKLHPEDVAIIVEQLEANTPFSPVPRVLVLTHTSEQGRVYTAAELEALCRVAKERGLRVHIDGARFANAIAQEPTSRSVFSLGASSLALGGTKNGQGPVEAVVLPRETGDSNRDRPADLARRAAKQLGYTTSKMRYWSAPMAAGILSGEYELCAGHANQRARDLSGRLEQVGLPAELPVEANLVFLRIPTELVAALHAWSPISHWDGRGLVRLACSWDHTGEDLERLVSGITSLVNS